MGRTRKGRSVNGILLLDKPMGLSSQQALSRVKYLFNAKKAGHTGTLDPMATGLLPLTFGVATRISGLLLEGDKRYFARVKLGEATDTLDAEGEVIATSPVPPSLTLEGLQQAAKSFIGQISQIPPMASALKHNGQRLYDLARQGIEVERKARDVTIYELDSLALDPHYFSFEVLCSKGTYVRTLAADLCEALGTVGHLVELRRLSSGPFSVADAASMASLDDLDHTALDLMLLPTDAALMDYPALIASNSQAQRVRQAGNGYNAQVDAGWYRLYDSQNCFLAMAEATDSGMVIPRKMMIEMN
ncbi:MAG: tRNA pseudouridine(55) synthase TruB [Gammaproteobacteria bacterium]|nr:tRNA pseudouridine(55) synthase TruB [Gammaproteobacteria bacterium]